MKILFLSHRIPYPPNKGDKIRSFNEIKYLAQKHDIHLLAFYDDPGEAQYKAELQRYCRTVTLIRMSRWKQSLRAGYAMLRGLPWSLGYFSDANMKKAEAEKRAKALDWLNILLKEHPGITKLDAIEKTALRFDLNPLEEEWLLQQLTLPPPSE